MTTALLQNKCPLCGEEVKNNSIFEINNIPTTQNIFYNTSEEAKNCLKGDINLVLCDNCSLVFNSRFEPDTTNYSESYSVDFTYSPYYVSYINNQIEHLIKSNVYNDNSTIIDVGCGKGFYINTLAEKLKGCSLYGFDTSYEGVLNIPDKNIRFVKSYYPSNDIEIKPDTIINRQVFEHITDPISFLKSFRNSLDLNSYLYIEVPDFDWIVNNNSIFDIYYEHCAYWSKFSLTNALRLTGFNVESIISSFDSGSVIPNFAGINLCVVAKAIENYGNLIKPGKDLKVDLKNHFSSLFSKYANSLKKIASINKNMAIWGAGPKGYTFVNFFDVDRTYFSTLIDINPVKTNLYIGKTAHKIISPSDIKSSKIDFIVILNPFYANEIKSYLFDNNLSRIDVIIFNDLL
ncbi:MAG: methyltransferase domain-containing protein [Deltaproteobacteria bacterium]|jgi:SAM-dependent methyltransferase|nr:methyltransferase domain-containing protein [Deltaproteobacteria bacterium]